MLRAVPGFMTRKMPSPRYSTLMSTRFHFSFFTIEITFLSFAPTARSGLSRAAQGHDDGLVDMGIKGQAHENADDLSNEKGPPDIVDAAGPGQQPGSSTNS